MKKISFTCDSCGALNSVSASNFNYESIDSEEREMGSETVYEGESSVTCACGTGISITHRFWEYPEGSPPNHEEIEIDGGTEV